MKNVALLGSTGSIGTQTLAVVKHLSGSFRIHSLTTLDDLEVIEGQMREFKPEIVCVVDEHAASKLRQVCGRWFRGEILSGTSAQLEMLTDRDIDIVVNAIVGSAGLEPSLITLKQKKRLCSANKESLVIGGSLIRESLAGGGELIPIDSEHSALLQASLSGHFKEIKNLILTASGGPFWDTQRDFSKVTIEETIAHPNWKMGPKISVDSATMMNKGLEVIEARWLFNIPPERIKVLIHPQSIVHSLVEFVDHSQIAQLSIPDMQLAIQYALTYPKRLSGITGPLNLSQIGELHFMEPDLERFPCLKLAYDALDRGGFYPVVLNAANEAAVELFLKGRIPLSQIPVIISGMMDEFCVEGNLTLDRILKTDREVKARIIN